MISGHMVLLVMSHKEHIHLRMQETVESMPARRKDSINIEVGRYSHKSR
jgi:hypothetical protein